MLFSLVHSGVPQGSVLGPILFSMSTITESHAITHHSFDDDLQLQLSAPPDIISDILHSMQAFISDIKLWQL